MYERLIKTTSLCIHEFRNVQNNKFVVGSFGLDSVPLTEGSILEPCYEMW